MSIPLTRLGDRAFNHSPGNDAEREYDRLRDLARQEAQKRGSCFDRFRALGRVRAFRSAYLGRSSHAPPLLTSAGTLTPFLHNNQSREAYQRGDGAEAKVLSNEGKRHDAAMDDYNRQASEFIFRENNAPGRVAEDTIDLHGQFVEEAERILEARIRDARARGQPHLHVIVGRGSHSAGGVQKIKPAVERVCRENGLHYATEQNEGRIYVDLQGGQVGSAPPLPQQPGGGAWGGQQQHGGGYPGHQQQPQYQQQPHHQQQQQHHQQQQQNQDDDIFGTLCGAALKKCCVIM